MKLQHYIVVNVAIHISKSKGVAETITFKNRLAYETSSSVLKCIVIQCLYVTAVCVRSLIKLRWLKIELRRYWYCLLNISFLKKETTPSFESIPEAPGR